MQNQELMNNIIPKNRSERVSPNFIINNLITSSKNSNQPNPPQILA